MKRRSIKLTALIALLALALMAHALPAPALAEEADTITFPYTYTVRVFSGNKGTFTTQGPAVQTNIEKGYRGLNLNDLYAQNGGKVTDTKYVKIGFRESGKDNDQQGSFIGGNGIVPYAIEFDMDFVVAYGVEADLVPYTLRFVEYGTGTELAAPQTYYGRDGDKPVVAYEYIEGYRPLYMSLTATLHKDQPNEWTFEYVKLAEGETFDASTMTTGTTTTEVPGTTTTNVTEVPGNTNVTVNETAGNGNGTVVTEPGTTTGVRTEVPGTTTTTYVPGTTTEIVSPGATTETTATVGGGAPAGGTGATGTTETTEATGATSAEAAPPATREILDLDTPLAGPGGATSSVPTAGAILLNDSYLVALLIALMVAIGLILFFIFKRKKDKENEAAAE